jgi:hypothetical protein
LVRSIAIADVGNLVEIRSAAVGSGQAERDRRHRRFVTDDQKGPYV